MNDTEFAPDTEQTIIEPGTDLAVVKTLTPMQVFAPGAVDPLLDRIAAEVRATARDASTKAGREAIASLAYRVARTKTTLDVMGKELVAEWKTKSAAVDAERRKIRERLDALRDEARKPLDDYEAAEAARVRGHEDALLRIAQISIFDHLPSSVEVESRMALLEDCPDRTRDWQEFTQRAIAQIADVQEHLQGQLTAAVKREADAAELERLRAEQAERERQEAARRQRERDAAIAAKAAEDARIAAELKAREEADAERRRIDFERRKAEQEAAAKLKAAEDERRAAEHRAAQAERERIAAEQRAKREQEAAIAAERERVAAKARAEAEAAAKREADKQHRTSINRAAVAALVTAGLSEPAAKAAITAIASGAVPNVRIVY